MSSMGKRGTSASSAQVLAARRKASAAARAAKAFVTASAKMSSAEIVAKGRLDKEGLATKVLNRRVSLCSRKKYVATS